MPPLSPIKNNFLFNSAGNENVNKMTSRYRGIKAVRFRVTPNLYLSLHLLKNYLSLFVGK